MAYLNNYITSSSVLSKASRSEIEFVFHKILSPIKKTADPNLIFQFCQKLSDIEDTQLAADLIVNKLLSTQEWEVLIALYILEACVKNCGEPMHEIIGRFRFLNEMIKLISPKYYGSRTSEQAKKKTVELIYSWSRDLPKKNKIKEAYEMIKKQGIVKEDPVYVEELAVNVAPREKNPIFEDEEKSKQLAILLKSKNVQDLEKANKIIKNMVKQDEIKTEKISSRINELEKINNNIKLLTDMLSQFNSKTAKSSEKETIKYLYDELEKLQPNLIKLATETDDNDESIGDILKTNDSCDTIMKKYQAVFDSKFNPDDALVNLNAINDEQLSTTAPEAQLTTTEKKTDSNKDLQDLFSGTNLADLYSKSNNVKPVLQASAPNIFDDLMSVQHDLTPNNNNSNFMNTSNSLNSLNQAPLQPVMAKTDSNNSLNIASISKPVVTTSSKPFDDLNELSKALMGDSLNFTPTAEMQVLKSQKINDLIKATNNQQNIDNNPIKPPLFNNNATSSSSATSVFEALNNTFIQLETIKPSIQIPSLNLYNKNNMNIMLHFARDSPSKNVSVIVISTTNTSMDHELKNFLFQAAVTKNMKVKLQPASRSDLPAFNPILPPQTITQIMLIANPLQEQVRLKYKLTYSCGGRDFVENDEVKNFPKLIDTL